MEQVMTEQLLLRVSATLYEHLGSIPKPDDRDAYIETIQSLLDERGTIIHDLQQNNFTFNPSNKMHAMLAELDKGIKSRLTTAMTTVKSDLKNLQNAKKNEKQYMNPYSSVRVMDGMYYDKKN